MSDLRFALRTALKSPGPALTAICTLALGIGANTAMFSIASGVLLRPLPFARPHRLVQLRESDGFNTAGAVYYSDLEGWRKRSRSFESMAAYGNISRNLEDVPDPERLAAVWAERGLFRMLGVQPLAGRTFCGDDPPGVVVIAEGLWRRRFAADPSCIGRSIKLDGQPYTVIGVMSEAFQFPYRASRTDVWIPWSVPPQFAGNPGYRVDFAAARLRPGVTIDSALRELAVLTNPARRAIVTPLSEMVAGHVRPALLTLLGAVGLVLLIACANVTNLLLARAAGRTREIAIRAALGASRGRLIRQLLVESLVLSAAGGLAALLLAPAGTSLLVKLAGSQIPRAWEIGLDWRVFSFLCAVSVATGLGFGIGPALAASRDAARDQSAAPRRRQFRDSLAVAEIALALVLLMGAGALLKAFLELQSRPTGLAADNVLTMRLTVTLRDWAAPGSYGRYLQQLEERIRQVPGVREAGFIQYLPLQNWGWSGGFTIDGRPPQTPEQLPRSDLRYVSPGYFHALGIPLRKGRLLSGQDTSGSPRVILINEALARRYFANEDPVGRHTDRGTIVGVVGDVKGSGLDRPATPEIYYAFAQNTAATSDAGVSLAVGTFTRPESLATAVGAAIHEVNRNQVIFDIRTMRRVIAASLADLNLYLWLAGLFAGLALLLSAAGIYGVVSYLVAARTREFGIRLALGATGGRILRHVLGRGSVLVGFGLALGAAGALALTRVLKSLVVPVNPVDAAVLTSAAALLGSVALAACLIPARRAMRVDPNSALRHE